MEIITVSDMECGDKPTKYCAVVKNRRMVDELDAHVRNGVLACGADPGRYDDHDIGCAWCYAMDRGFGWLGERFLVEITEVMDYKKGENE